MSDQVTREQALNKLQHALEAYDKVLFIEEAGEFGKCLEEMEEVINQGGEISFDKILLLVKEPYFACPVGFAQMVLGEEEWEVIDGLYYMYEFSNGFQIVSKNEMYGSIFNLVDKGLLTYLEALEAILR